ncbi:MAG TPA: hypothetical protein VFI95_02305 [Terriglobales bacterium]|nr:hypothetical protein [Terriglobales bacterium]
MKKTSAPLPRRLALVVHPDLAVLSSVQSALGNRGINAIVARDLPTALLAINQHYFELAVVATHLQENGDGWPLAGVIHLVFPKAFVCVLSPNEPDVLSLQSAINYGVREIYSQSSAAPELVDAIITRADSAMGGTSRTSRVQ